MGDVPSDSPTPTSRSTTPSRSTSRPARWARFSRSRWGLSSWLRSHNAGRVGILQHLEKHDGSFSIVTVKDKKGNVFATRQSNVFIIGAGERVELSLPKGRGIKKNIIQERAEAEARGDL